MKPPTQIPSMEPIPSSEGIQLLSTTDLWSMVANRKESQTSSFQLEATPKYSTITVNKLESLLIFNYIYVYVSVTCMHFTLPPLLVMEVMSVLTFLTGNPVMDLRPPNGATAADCTVEARLTVVTAEEDIIEAIVVIIRLQSFYRYI